jgi:putative protein kinase ArgK-like GTPase of G3E family
VLARDRDAVAEALNLVEDRRAGPRAAALRLLERLEREAPFPGAPRIGITGPPGAGKSSLLDALVRQLRSRGERLACESLTMAYSDRMNDRRLARLLRGIVAAESTVRGPERHL